MQVSLKSQIIEDIVILGLPHRVEMLVGHAPQNDRNAAVLVGVTDDTDLFALKVLHCILEDVNR